MEKDDIVKPPGLINLPNKSHNNKYIKLINQKKKKGINDH